MLTHLSKDFYNKIISSKLNNIFFLQILNIKYLKKSTVVILSNGIIKENVHINPKFNLSKIKKWEKGINNILRVKLIKWEDLLILSEFNLFLVYDEIIGNPITVRKFIKLNFKNIKGDNSLPEVWLNNKKNINENKHYSYINSLSQNDINVILNVRCIQKSQIKEFYNKKGKYFSCEFLDNTNKIKAMFFNEITDLFYNNIEEGKVYEIYNITIKLSKYTNNIEIHFKKDSKIKKVKDIGNIPKYNFEFCQVSNIKNKNVKDYIDIISIIYKIGDKCSLKLKNGDYKNNKKVSLIDNTEHLINLSWWDDNADNLNFNIGDIIIITKAKIAEFNKIKYLTLDFKSLILKKIPNLEIYKDLIKWKKSKFNELSNKSFQSKEYDVKNAFKSIKQVYEEVKDLKPNQTKFFNILAYISYIKEKFFYLSCKNKECKKKVIYNQNQYHCEKCNYNFHDAIPRFFSWFKISDSTSNLFVNTLSDNINKVVYGKNCEELYKMQQDSCFKFNEYLLERSFIQYKFLIKADNEFYNNENKVKFTIIKIVEPNSGYSKVLFDTFKLTFNEI